MHLWDSLKGTINKGVLDFILVGNSTCIEGHNGRHEWQRPSSLKVGFRPSRSLINSASDRKHMG